MPCGRSRRAARCPRRRQLASPRAPESRAPHRDDDLDSRLAVAVVNEAFARRHFGRDNPVGRRFRAVGEDEQPGPWRTIVGVTSTVRMLGVYNSPLVDDSGFYIPFYGTLEGPVPPAPAPSGVRHRRRPPQGQPARGDHAVRAAPGGGEVDPTFPSTTSAPRRSTTTARSRKTVSSRGCSRHAASWPC